jgi:hypothetical protein
MRPMSKKAKAESYDALKNERDALAEYAWHIVNRKDADAFTTIEGSLTIGEVTRLDDMLKGEVTRFDVYGMDRAHGGIVVIAHYYDDQSASCTVEYFEAWAAKIHNLGFATEHTSALQYAREELQRKLRLKREYRQERDAV